MWQRNTTHVAVKHYRCGNETLQNVAMKHYKRGQKKTNPALHACERNTTKCGKEILQMWQRNIKGVAKKHYRCGKETLKVWQRNTTDVAKKHYRCGKETLQM